MKIRLEGAALFYADSQTDGQTDTMELLVALLTSLTMFKAQMSSYVKCYTRSGPVSVVPRVTSRSGI